MSEEKLEILKDKAENGDEEAIKKLADYYDSVGNANEAEIWKELLSDSAQNNDDKTEEDFIYSGSTLNKMTDEEMLNESKKYNSGEYKKYSFLKLDETLSTNPYVNFEYGDRYRNEQNVEKAIFYYKKGIQLLETYNSSNREIQSDIQWRWVDIARLCRRLRGQNDELAGETYNAYQNVLEVAIDDVFKIEAYLGLSECYEKGIGVLPDLDKADEYIKKAHTLYVEGCLIEARLSLQRKDNIEMRKWLEKAQTVNVLGYGKYDNDEYFHDVLNAKLWLCNIKKLDEKNPEITLELIYNIYNFENKDSHHILANYLLSNERQELKQKATNLISESLKLEYKNINSKDLLYNFITSGNFNYSTNEEVSYRMREFLKHYVIENVDKNVIATSLIINLYKLLVEFNEEAEEWKRKLGENNQEIVQTIDNELARLEQEEKKKKELERQAKLAEELRLEQEKQRQIDAEKRRLAEEAEREKQRLIEEEQKKQRLAEEAEREKQKQKIKLETARKECAEIEEKILKCSSIKNASSKSDEEFFSSIKKPIVVFLAILVIINVLGMGRHDGLVVFCFIVYMLYKLLYADQPQFIVDAIKESLNVDIKTWKSENETVSHDFEILVSNSFVISDKENLKVYFGKFENCGLFTNEAGKSIVKMNGEIENYQNVWIKGYQTTFKGIMMYGALYINLDMNSVIDGEASLDDTSLEMHNFLVEKC